MVSHDQLISPYKGTLGYLPRGDVCVGGSSRSFLLKDSSVQVLLMLSYGRWLCAEGSVLLKVP